jgi:hypothetical protein
MTQELAEVTEDITTESEIKVIPIDKPLQDFYNHLSYNERIIFSAKFGDGKTYFLNKFFEDKKEEFEAIRIFPVNYQVADNKDVFELIKKDILIHLLANDLIEDEDFFDESIYAQNYLFNNGADIVLDILSSVSAVKTPVEILKKSLKQIKKFKEEKAEFEKSSVDFIEDYLGQFENGKGVAEYDVISELITRIVSSIQEKGRKVVLVIDDLDRIDPAHLFRILNVLTAHIDRGVVLQNEIENGVGNNKFNFDHIITVFDFQNTQKIFHHLYGAGTDFNGYIAKFISGKPFEYFFAKKSMEYVIGYLSEKYGIDENILKITEIREAIRNASIRDKIKLVSSFEKEIINFTLEKGDVKYSSINSFTFFIVLLKRLNINKAILNKDLLKLDSHILLNLIGVGFYLGKNISLNENVFNNTDRHGSIYGQNVNVEKTDGLVKKVDLSLITFQESFMRNEIDYLFDKWSLYIKA